jgi:hypothetical protein
MKKYRRVALCVKVECHTTPAFLVQYLENFPPPFPLYHPTVPLQAPTFAEC